MCLWKVTSAVVLDGGDGGGRGGRREREGGGERLDLSREGEVWPARNTWFLLA